ncbi:heparan sulfate glucosamine 3-o-sulfotransferase 5-like protein [Plakobranchus ocellatus]|uniref:Heparan sulfate glucosamine 3-o-sulfotransferase 5-like protein n=1 Tax=Plakobranchus ocellatus TaxID=259542 RepID=A0AAV4ADZ0_9GAST|nr:heparan sulfate glucosamine 3-o-sulfotransferase 5-like protein [Plakobranchus ocellatus]
MAMSMKDGSFSTSHHHFHYHHGRVLTQHRMLVPRRHRVHRGNHGIITAFAASCVVIVLVTYFETSRMLIPSKVVTRSDLHQLTSGFTKDVPKKEEQPVNTKFPSHLTPHPHRPSAMMVGFSHCSGNLLASALSAHPDVVVNRRSTKFFSGNQSLRWYLSQMPPSLDHHVTVDVGLSYVTNRTHLKRIKAYNESIKIIVIVCNPISRLIANQSEFLRTIGKTKVESLESKILVHSMKSTLYTEVDGKRRLDAHKLSKIGDFFQFLVDLFLLFPRKNVLVVERNRLYKNPISQWAGIYKFLGVPPYRQATTFDQSSGELCFNVSSVQRSCVKDPYVDVSRVFREADATSMQESVRNFYRPLNKRLYMYLEDQFDW